MHATKYLRREEYLARIAQTKLMKRYFGRGRKGGGVMMGESDKYVRSANKSKWYLHKTQSSESGKNSRRGKEEEKNDVVVVVKGAAYHEMQTLRRKNRMS